MERIVVSDTNILIDLVSIGLLDDFFELPIEVHTTDMIVLEIENSEQMDAIKHLISSNRLIVKSFSPKEMSDLLVLYADASKRTNVSIQDCSVWHYAQKNNYVLLTGDMKLRKMVISTGVEVHGILYVFDLMLKHGVIAPKKAIDKLRALYNINNRLPEKEIEKRLVFWASIKGKNI